MMKVKNILIVSYYFYPFSQIGAKRISCLADFLNDKGMKVTIVKAANDSYGKNIDKGLKVNDQIEIVEVNNVSHFKTLLQKISCSIKFYMKIKHCLNIRKYNSIFFSGGPYFYFPLGMVFKHFHKTPYILDFRDPWIIANRRMESLNWKGRIFRHFESFLEKNSISNSLISIYVTQKIVNFISSKLNKINKAKFFIIENGFDERELPQLDFSNNKSKIIKMGIFGKFAYYNTDNARIIAESISLLDEDFDIKIYQIGEIENQFSENFSNRLLDDKLIEMGYLNYKKAIKFLSKMDILLLNHRSEFLMGTKVYEYLYLNKPIFAFVNHDTAIWDFLSKYKNTYRIETTENFIKSIKTVSSSQDRSVINEKELLKFSRQYQYQKLYKVLQEKLA